MAKETYSGVRAMAVSGDGIRFVKNIMAPTRDGTKLAMDIHVLAGKGPRPVVLTYIPYRKDDRKPMPGMQHHAGLSMFSLNSVMAVTPPVPT